MFSLTNQERKEYGMIRIICGTCGTSKGYKTAADGELTLPAAEERRLVVRGVAEYVTMPIIGPANAPGSPVAGFEDSEVYINPSSDAPPAERLENGGSDIPGGTLPGSAAGVDIIDGHFDWESLMQLTRQQMEKLAADMSVDVSRCKNKGDIAGLLVEVDVASPVEAGGEAPPMLGVEAPVV